MKSLKGSQLLLLAGLVASVAPARALVSLGSDSQLFATLNTSVQYNDNLFLSTPRTSDTVFDVTPGLLLEFGKNAQFSGQAYASEDFQLFSDNSGLNTSLSHIGANGHYDDGKSKFDINASFQQADQATRDIRPKTTVTKLVHRDVTNAAATEELLFTEKTSVSAGVSYNDINYKSAGYVDYQSVSIPVKYYYKFEPKLDVSAGYRYRRNTLGTGGFNSDDHFFSVGARGELTPKLTGEISTGYNEFKPTIGKSQSGLGLEANLNYAFSPKTTITFGATDGFGYVATGDANRAAGLNAGITTTINSNWQLGASAAYTRYSYLRSINNRADDFYTAQLFATYTINEYASITGAYAYADNKSNVAGNNFTDNIVSVSVSLKY